MDTKEFSSKTANFLADYMRERNFHPDDENQYFKFPTPMYMGGIIFQIYSAKQLFAFKVNKDRTEQVLFTFFIGTAEAEEKAKFLQEVENKRTGQPTNEDVINRYVNAFLPSSEDYQNLCRQLKNVLEQKIYEGKGYVFSPLFTAPDADYDPIIVFLEDGSVNNLQKVYPEELIFDASF